VKDIIYRESMQDVIELRHRIITVAECITNEMIASTWRETEYCLDVCSATNDDHTEICWAQKTLCEVQCLKMYLYIQ
jgi:hypothetical protein